MKNAESRSTIAGGWTGGHYLLRRIVFALVVLVAIALGFGVRAPSAHDPRIGWIGAAPRFLAFAAEIPDAGRLLLALVSLLAAVIYAAGIAARLSLFTAAAAATIFAAGSDRAWFFSGQALALYAVAHLFLADRPLPFGAFGARGRVDPAGEWTMPRRVRILGHAALSVFLLATIDGRMRALDWAHFGPIGSLNENYLRTPLAWYGGAGGLIACEWRRHLVLGTVFLDALYVLMGLFLFDARARRYPLFLAFLAHLAATAFLGVSAMTGGTILLFLAAIDPDFIGRPARRGIERVFYDGSCGLCHRAVRFILAEDPRGETFRFAALQGKTAEELLRPLGPLPDSIVCLTDEGRVLVRSGAILFIMMRLGGYWRCLAAIGRLIPCFVRDAAYDGIARTRKRLFTNPKDLCPMMPKPLRERFDP